MHVTCCWDSGRASLAVEITRDNRDCIGRIAFVVELVTSDYVSGFFGILYIVTTA